MSSLHIIVGRIGRDAEIRETQNGRKVASFTVASNESWTDSSSGERRERTEWLGVTTFQPGLVTMLEKYASKGRLVRVVGTLRSNKYRAEGEAKDRIGWTTEVGPHGEIEFLTPREDQDEP